MSILFKQVTMIGVGLIGGSLALVMKRKHLATKVIGYDRRRWNLQKAVTVGMIDRYFLTLQKAVQDSDLVILATPMGTFERICQGIAPYLKPGAIVTDVGSVKGALVEKMASFMPEHAYFVGGHPIAGREKSGVEAAREELFEGNLCILTPTAKTPAKVLSRVAAFWTAVGASVVKVDPLRHDAIMAAVSHLPHLVAYAMVEVLAHPKIAKMDPIAYSGGGLRDFTRIAESSPEMWRDIFLLNDQKMVEMIDLYQETLEKMKKKIIAKDGEGLLEAFTRAKTVRQERLA